MTQRFRRTVLLAALLAPRLGLDAFAPSARVALRGRPPARRAPSRLAARPKKPRGGWVEGSPRQRAERAAEYWRDPEVDACPIFVEYRRKVSLLGVPRGFTCARLRAVFDAQFGPVAVAEVIDSKLAYITFWEPEHAAAAVQTNVVFERADGDDWEVQPRYHERKNDDARRGTCANLFIGNLPYDVTDATFQQLIEPFSVTGVRRVPEKGIAFVTLDSAETADTALTSLKSARVFGRAIRVDYDERRNPRPTRQRTTAAEAARAKEEAVG